MPRPAVPVAHGPEDVLRRAGLRPPAAVLRLHRTSPRPCAAGPSSRAAVPRPRPPVFQFRPAGPPFRGVASRTHRAGHGNGAAEHRDRKSYRRYDHFAFNHLQLIFLTSPSAKGPFWCL